MRQGSLSLLPYWRVCRAANSISYLTVETVVLRTVINFYNLNLLIISLIGSYVCITIEQHFITV